MSPPAALDEHSQELLRLLAQDSAPLSRYAARRLAGVDAPEVRAALLERLREADVELAADLAAELEPRLDAAGRREALRALLGEGSPGAQVAALSRWADALEGDADEVLGAQLAAPDQDPRLVATLLSALGRRREPLPPEVGRRVTPLLGHENARVRANAAELVAARHGQEGFAVLALLLEDPVPRVRAAAAKGVWSLDRDAVQERILADLESEDPRDTLAALHVLGCLPEFPESLELLCRYGRARDPGTRLMALRSLAGREAELEVDWLFERYMDEDSRACQGAVAARAKAGPRAAFCARLAKVLRDEEDARRRARAARGIGEAGGPEEEALLVPFVTDEDDRIRADAVEGLGAIAGEGVERLLQHALQDGAPRVAANAAVALWRRGGHETLDLLVGWLRSDDPARAASAAFALGELGSERVVAPLLDVSERLREEGASSFAEKGLERQVRQALEKVRGE